MFEVYDLISYDCKYIAATILTDFQYILWEVKWRRALERLIASYDGGQNAALTLAQLADDPPHNRPKHQATDLPQNVVADIKEAAQKAILQIQPTVSPEGTFTEVKQGASEPFTSFIDQLA